MILILAFAAIGYLVAGWAGAALSVLLLCLLFCAVGIMVWAGDV